jgi:hypothetical protein
MSNIEKILYAALIIVSLAALAVVAFSPSIFTDVNSVYGRF